jgi:hypothetical protein
MVDRVKQILAEMAELLEDEGNIIDHEERLGELYYEGNDALMELHDYVTYGGRASEVKEYHALQKQFTNFCSEFETPEDIKQGAMEDMFPNGMDDGFNVDDFFDRD